jgi:uncharacterized OB-fold protein
MSNPTLPPAARTPLGHAQTAAATEGKLTLQQCAECSNVQYPPREVCGHCLSGELHWQETGNGGTVLAAVMLHRSLEAHFQQQTPWLLGTVKLDCGPVALVQLPSDCREPGCRVLVTQDINASGEAVLIAKPEGS